jgi:hypothetical protein
VKLDDLGDKLFASTTEAGAILGGTDPRTIRRAIAAGEIPGRRIGNKLMIPVAWLREQVLTAAPESSQPTIDLNGLADCVADRVFARIARAFGRQALDVNAADPAPPGPATIANDPLPATKQGHVHDYPAV